MTTGNSGMRFALDEAKARDYIARIIGQNDAEWDEGPQWPFETDEDAPGIRSSWQPGLDDGDATAYLVACAHHKDIITCTAAGERVDAEVMLDVSWEEDGSRSRWVVYLPSGGLLLASYIEPVGKQTLTRDMKGAEAAMQVLRQAVKDGNQLLEKLEAHVAAQTSKK